MAKKAPSKSKSVWPLLIVVALVFILAKSGGHLHLNLPHPSEASVSQSRSEAYAQKVFKNDSTQQACLIALWDQESGWNANAVETAWINGNPPTYAYGIAQINPSTFGHPVAMGDWKAQIRWGYHYIKRRYGTPCNAEAHEQQYGWY